MTRLADDESLVVRAQQFEEPARHTRVEGQRRWQLHQQRPALVTEAGDFVEEPHKRRPRNVRPVRLRPHRDLKTVASPSPRAMPR